MRAAGAAAATGGRCLQRPLAGVTREEHAKLADEYNGLVAATNDLIEGLNWTR